MWNDELRWPTTQSHLLTIVQARHLSMFGHTARMPDKQIPKKILTASPLENWSRPPGRPRTMCMKTIQQDLKSNNFFPNDAIDVAQNRPLGDLCLLSALRTPSGGCQKQVNEMCICGLSDFVQYRLPH